MFEGKKITLATVKSFIRKNREDLMIRNRSSFNSMTDGVEGCADSSYRKAEPTERNVSNTLGIMGAWFVGSSRDRFMPVDSDEHEGIGIYNCCGSFDLVIAKV